jgi:CRP-like cAMP-binding protein
LCKPTAPEEAIDVTAYPEFERTLFTERRDVATELGEANRLLAALAPADFDLLAPHLRDESFQPGTVIHEAGQPIRNVYFPRQGLVGMVCATPDGFTIETASIGREGAVGAMAAIMPAVAHGRAVAYLPLRAAQIPAARLMAVADQSSALRQMIARYADVVMAQAQQTAACNAMHSVQERLCRWLLQAQDLLGSDILPVTQEFLSEALGVQRTTVTMAAKVLQKQGLIQVRRGRIHIRDGVGLDREACGCCRALRRLVRDPAVVQMQPAEATHAQARRPTAAPVASSIRQ